MQQNVRSRMALETAPGLRPGIGTKSAPDNNKTLRWMLTIIVFYVPLQLHFPQGLGIPGVNVFNLLLFIGFVLALQLPKQSKGSPHLKGAIIAFYVVVLISLAIGLSSSEHMFKDIQKAKTLFAYSLLYFLTFRAVQDLEMLRHVLYALMIAVAVAALEIAKEAVSYGLGTDRRLAGPFGHNIYSSNYAGVFFTIFLPLALTAALFLKSYGRKRLWAAAIFGLGTFATLYTVSRQALFSIALSTLIIGVRRSFVIGIVATLVLANYELYAPDSVVNRIDGTTQTNDDGDQELDRSTESRFEIWSGAQELISENPIGIGFNQFPDRIAPYLTQEDVVIDQTNEHKVKRDAHSVYVLLTTECGIQGGVVLIFMFFSALFLGIRAYNLGNRKNCEEGKWLGFGFSLSCLAVIMGNIMSSTFMSGEVMGNFWILAALVSRYIYLMQEDKLNLEEDTPEETTPAPLRGPRSRRLARGGR